MSRIVSGFDELAQILSKLPEWAAPRLQGIVIRQHLDHRDEVIDSSHITDEGKRNIKYAIRVFPGGGGDSGRGVRQRVEVNRLADVTGETVTFWKGLSTNNPDLGTAARIEKSIGSSTNKPLQRQYLVIPQGDFATPSGRPRRQRIGGKMIPIDLAKLPNTKVITLRDGRKIVVQDLAGGAAGAFEEKARRDSRRAGLKVPTLGVKKKLPQRTRIVAVMDKQVRGFQGLDFFGAWTRLEAQRTANYDRFLDEVMERIATGRTPGSSGVGSSHGGH